jgi:hyaluronan synthase
MNPYCSNKMWSCSVPIRILLVLALIGSLVAFAILHIAIGISADITLSFYGLFILFYLLIEATFALLNRRRVNIIRSGDLEAKYKEYRPHVINCVIPGYMEEPDYYKACLNSYKSIEEKSDIRIKHVIFVIDGIDSDGLEYMREIFTNVFKEDGQLIILRQTLHDNPVIELDLTLNKKFICIMQPHGGKREALYTGFKLSVEDREITAVVTSDSDSVMDSRAVIELTTMFNDKRVAAATGYVDIFNDETVISYMSRLRYFFSGNLERSYESYKGCVLCMSGPLSIYRADLLKGFLPKWINQHFLGKPCTYGDDRHLTNCILKQGAQTMFTHHATCITETPTTLTRFLRQQLRWNKSSNREMGWTMKFIAQHSIWMTVDVAYQTLYTLFIFGSILYIVYGGMIDNLITYCYGLIIISFLRSLFGVILNRDIKYFLYSYYAVIYLSLMIPLKIFSMVKITDTSWGTRGRVLTSMAVGEWSSVIIWNVIILGGLARKLYNQYNDITYNQIYLLAAIPIFYLVLYLIIKTRAYLNHRRYKKVSPLAQYLAIELTSVREESEA